MNRSENVTALAAVLAETAPWADPFARWAAVWAGTGHPKACYRVRPDGAIEVRPGRATERRRLLNAGFVRKHGTSGFVYVLYAPKAPSPSTAVLDQPVRETWELATRFEVRGYVGFTGGSQTVFELPRASWSDARALVLARLAAGEITAADVKCYRDTQLLGVYRMRFLVQRLESTPPA